MSDGSKDSLGQMTPEERAAFDRFIQKESHMQRDSGGDLHPEPPSDPAARAGNEAALERLGQDSEYLGQRAEEQQSWLADGTRKYLERLRRGCKQYYTSESMEKLQDLSDHLVENWGGTPEWIRVAAARILTKATGLPGITPMTQAQVDELGDLIHRTDGIGDLTSNSGWQDWGFEASCIDMGAKTGNQLGSYSDDLDEDCMIYMQYKDLSSSKTTPTWGKDRGLGGDVFVRTTDGCIFPVQFIRDGRINEQMIDPNSHVFINLNTWKDLQFGTLNDQREFMRWKSRGKIVFPSASAFNNAPLTVMKEECLIKHYVGDDGWLTNHPVDIDAYAYLQQRWGPETAGRIMAALRVRWPDWPVAPRKPAEPLKPVFKPAQVDPTQGVSGPWIPELDQAVNSSVLAPENMLQTNSTGQVMGLTKAMRRAAPTHGPITPPFVARQDEPAPESSFLKNVLTVTGVLLGIWLAIRTTPLAQLPTDFLRPAAPAATRYIPPAEPVVRPTEFIPPPEAPQAEPQQAPPPQPQSADRCSLFDGVEMTTMWLDPPTMYVKIPGGVPGLGKDVPGDYEAWEYSLDIGGYSTDSCHVEPGFPDRLYCQVSVPSGYYNSWQTLNLSVNGCPNPVFNKERADIFPNAGRSSSGSGDSGSGSSGLGCTSGEEISLDQDSCTAQGYNWIDVYCYCP